MMKLHQTAIPASRTQRLRELSRDLEATFLAEMLKHSGLNQTSGPFGGGPGEEAFASLLNQEFAASLAARGGIGLAESIFNTLVREEAARV